MRLPETRLRERITNAVAHLERPEEGSSWIRASEEASRWCLEVASSGLGIPAEIRGRVFRMFSSQGGRDGEKHTGIGLAVARKLVRSYDGEAEVTDNVPRGALFRLYWPK